MEAFTLVTFTHKVLATHLQFNREYRLGTATDLCRHEYFEYFYCLHYPTVFAKAA